MLVVVLLVSSLTPEFHCFPLFLEKLRHSERSLASNWRCLLYEKDQFKSLGPSTLNQPTAKENDFIDFMNMNNSELSKAILKMGHEVLTDYDSPEITTKSSNDANRIMSLEEGSKMTANYLRPILDQPASKENYLKDIENDPEWTKMILKLGLTDFDSSEFPIKSSSDAVNQLMAMEEKNIFQFQK